MRFVLVQKVCVYFDGLFENDVLLDIMNSPANNFIILRKFVHGFAPFLSMRI